MPFVISEQGIDAYGNSTILSLLQETGVAGADTILRFGKVPDPLDSNRVAYLLRLNKGDPDTAGTTKRVELSQGGSGGSIVRGIDYWISTAFLTPSIWKNGDALLVGNLHGSNDETLVWQIHDNGDVGDDSNMNPNMAMTLHSGGNTTPQNSMQNLIIRTNPNPVTIKVDNVTRTVFSEKDYVADTWQYWIFKLRLHWDSLYNPYIQAWRRVGYVGDWTQVVSDNLPNQYNNVNNDFQKAGIYYYVNAWTGGITSRLLHSKGLYLFRDDGRITLSEITAFMDKI